MFDAHNPANNDDKFDKLADSIADLLVQIEISDFRDVIGHPLKKNAAYLKVKDLVEIKGEVRN
ncbi:MAG: hypothetical protein AB6733_00210 [Clostridiaceae bacterium]